MNVSIVLLIKVLREISHDALSTGAIAFTRTESKDITITQYFI